MFKKLLVIATLAAGLISTQASAAFVSTDWKVAGDKQAILHEETGLEWLKLDHTFNYSVRSVLNRIENGELAGWRLPTAQEVNKLFIDFFSPLNVFVGHTTSSVYRPKVSLFSSYFGQVWVSGSGWHGKGRYQDENGVWRYAGQSTGNFYGLRENRWLGSFDSNWIGEGVFLVSDGGTTLSSINDPTLNINNPNAPINMADVSAPAGLAAAGVLMLMLGARRRSA